MTTNHIDAMVNTIKSLGLYNCYMVAPMASVDMSFYWNALEYADTLKYRWSDMWEPTAKEVMARLTNQEHHYAVVDCDTNEVVSEFALESFTGKAAQVHFSMRPDSSTNIKMYLADAVTDQILYNWKDVKDLHKTYLETIFGLTPVDNRVACIFIQKVGFKKLGVLPKGTKYLGNAVDALITTKTRN